MGGSPGSVTGSGVSKGRVLSNHKAQERDPVPGRSRSGLALQPPRSTQASQDVCWGTDVRSRRRRRGQHRPAGATGSPPASSPPAASARRPPSFFHGRGQGEKFLPGPISPKRCFPLGTRSHVCPEAHTLFCPEPWGGLPTGSFRVSRIESGLRSGAVGEPGGVPSRKLEIVSVMSLF